MKEESIVELDFIGHTDFAASVRQTYHCPGAVKLGAYFDHFRDQNPEGTTILDAGDILVAAPIMHLSDGRPVMDVVNQFGYDAMNLGNHEFDHGSEKMEKLLTQANFPLLCANIIEKDTGKLLSFVEPYVIIEKMGVKIGILGVITEHTPFMVKKEPFSPFAVTSVVEACNRYIPVMKAKGAEIIVVLSHLPGRIDENGAGQGELFEVADQIQGAHIIFGGHNKADLAVTYNGMLLSKAGHSAVSIGHIKVAYDKTTGKIECLVNEIIDLMNDDLQVDVNPQMVKKVEQIMAPYTETLDEVLGEAKDDLVVDRGHEFSLGNFYTDCMRDVCGAQIGLMNSTSCYGFMPRGPITAEMIMYLMCFNDHIFQGFMTGQQLKNLIERTYMNKHLKLNGTIQFSGMKAVIDTRKSEGDRLVSLTLENGEPVKNDRQYKVATSAYIASGGNDYQEIIGKTEWEQTEFMTHPVFIEKMRERKQLGSELDSRLVDLAEQTA